MCGIVGIISNQPVCGDLEAALVALEHRGRDSTGIIGFDTKNNKFGQPIRGAGSSSEVFRGKGMGELPYTLAIGHNRYATIGNNLENDAQPLLIQNPGIAMAHNGQIANYLSIREQLDGTYSFLTGCDVEALMLAFAENIKSCNNGHSGKEYFEKTIIPAMAMTYGAQGGIKVIGAYSAVAIIAGKGLLAFKDPHGIRPLGLAKRTSEGKVEYAFASETTAFHYLRGFHEMRELKPGEVIFIDLNLNLHSSTLLNLGEKSCPFESVYFAQVDSNLRGEQVYDARTKLGFEISKVYSHMKDRVDVITPIPKSPIPASIALANTWDKEYGGIVARPSHSPVRAFQKEEGARGKSIDGKFLFIKSHIKGKRVGVVDDSIVRGDTSRAIVARLYSLGAKEVHMFVTYPPFIGICPGGIDIAEYDELLLKENSPEAIEEARKTISATTLNYLPIESVLEAVNLCPKTACLGCTMGQYPFDMSDYQRFQKLRVSEREMMLTQ